MAWEAEKESRLLVHLLLLQISLYPIMSWIPGAGLHRWYFWLNYIEVAEMIFSTLWNVRIKLLSLPPQHNSMERWDGTLTSVKKPWIFAKNPVNPFLSRGHTARLEQNLSPHKSTHPDNFMLVLFPEEAAGFTHTCHPSPAPAAQPPELQNINRIPMAAPWSPSKLTCHNPAVLLRALCLGGLGGFGGSSPPDEMFLPTERGLRCIHGLDQQLLWSKLDVANLSIKQNKKNPSVWYPRLVYPARCETQVISLQLFTVWGNDVTNVVFSLCNTD